MLNVATEFGGTAPHSLSEYYGVASNVPTSGTISLSDFYGKTNNEIMQVAAGYNQTFILYRKNGVPTLRGFGSNRTGQLGRGVTGGGYGTHLAADITLGSLSGKTISRVICGLDQTLVIATDGTLHVFGYWNNTTYNTPLQISNGSIVGKSIKAVSVGDASQFYVNGSGKVGFMILLATDNTLHAAGYSNWTESMGGATMGFTVNRTCSGSYIGSISGKTIVDVASGRDHTVLLASDGTVHGFGQAGWYALTSPTTQTASPILMTGGSLTGKTATAIACGSHHTIVLASDGTVHGVGRNDSGQLGSVGYTSGYTGTFGQITGGSLTGKVVVAIATAVDFTLFLDSQGNLHGVGSQSYNCLGNPSYTGSTTLTTTPLQSTAGSLSGKTFSAIECGSHWRTGDRWTIVLANDNTVHTYGSTGTGLIGRTGGSQTSGITPTDMTNIVLQLKGKPTTITYSQSSVRSGYIAATSQFMRDGSVTTSTTCTVTNYGTEWIQMDFGASIAIAAVIIGQGIGGYVTSSAGSILYSNDGSNWTTFLANVYDPNDEIRVVVCGFTARYVRISRSASSLSCTELDAILL